MRPTVEEVSVYCPGVETKLVEEHLTRLSDRYFARFTREQICRHLQALSKLSPDNPVEVLLEDSGEHKTECTVLAFDYPSLFSLITGVLAGMAFDVLCGDVFTYAPAAVGSREQIQRRRIRRHPSPDPLKRRRIVDHFSGVVATSLAFDAWAAELRGRLEQVIALLESGESRAVSEAKHQVNEMVVKQLARLQLRAEPALYPVQIEVDNSSGPHTRLKIFSENTPAFLYSLSNALSRHGISIEHVRIRTIHERIEDEIDIADSRGKKIEDPDVLGRIKLSVLLTKQFTYFLNTAPDPYAALSRFETLVQDILSLPEKGQWLPLLSNPHTLQELARLLGTSDFLWEDFIRLHYETLLPMLEPFLQGQRFSQPMQELPHLLEQSLEGAVTVEEQGRRLNEFKDREIYHIDLDHILSPEPDFRVLSEKLTCLAELVVNKAAELAYAHLRKRYGTPRTAAGLEARFTILGLGKLGGASLGYASDLEFLVVYSDNGQTDGEEVVANSEFFDHLVRTTAQFIQAKREGIFQVDLRLRPFGSSGPLACSLENFCRYYGPGGESHSYERLALVRLRSIGGDPVLGAQVERLRDELIYASQSIDLGEIRALRERQFREKTEGGKPNAKFSPGGLVDLEYDVQILQVIYGREAPQLRTPLMHTALAALAEAGVLSPEETQQLIAAYEFLRRLINAMRMLRGSARDLFLPPPASVEFSALARRMRYSRGGALDPAQQLYIDFETHTAAVRAFAHRHFGEDSLPASATGTVADLVLSEAVPQELRNTIIDSAGFTDPERAYRNLRALAGDGPRRQAFARLALLAADILSSTPNPDMALNNWERFIRTLPSPEFHYNLLLSQPMRLEILLTVFSGSQFLSDTLIRNPGFLDWVTAPENLHRTRTREDHEGELRLAAESCRSHGLWLNQLRRFRRRELLRIGTRDMYLDAATEDVMLELSNLAEALIQVALEWVWTEALREEWKALGPPEKVQNQFCILAFGKLGGSELNYSSDIDLLGIFDVPTEPAREPGEEAATRKHLCKWVLERLALDLSLHSEEGHAYRVDLRLRPYGRSGELVPSLSSLVDYYHRAASLWEIQAALKLRPVAGNIALGHRFLESIRPLLLRSRSRQEIVRSVEAMRTAAARKKRFAPTLDVKSGMGGLRDVEFLVQGLQLIHAPRSPELLEPNTLAALKALAAASILPESLGEQLRRDYLFWRRVEHYLQILEDRQIHALPRDDSELEALAKRVLGKEHTGPTFMEVVQECVGRVREAYTTHLLAGGT